MTIAGPSHSTNDKTVSSVEMLVYVQLTGSGTAAAAMAALADVVFFIVICLPSFPV